MQVEEIELLETVTTEDCYDLVVYNDDVNTFEHVIETLVKVCKHNLLQAEQCTMIIHYKGKCSVKTGGYNELAEMRNAIFKRGISAEVE
jgi:ATP-dependent Clp protease adaptor protein ClpS